MVFLENTLNNGPFKRRIPKHLLQELFMLPDLESLGPPGEHLIAGLEIREVEGGVGEQTALDEHPAVVVGGGEVDDCAGESVGLQVALPGGEQGLDEGGGAVDW